MGLNQPDGNRHPPYFYFNYNFTKLFTRPGPHLTDWMLPIVPALHRGHTRTSHSKYFPTASPGHQLSRPTPPSALGHRLRGHLIRTRVNSVAGLWRGPERSRGAAGTLGTVNSGASQPQASWYGAPPVCSGKCPNHSHTQAGTMTSTTGRSLGGTASALPRLCPPPPPPPSTTPLRTCQARLGPSWTTRDLPPAGAVPGSLSLWRATSVHPDRRLGPAWGRGHAEVLRDISSFSRH